MKKYVIGACMMALLHFSFAQKGKDPVIPDLPVDEDTKLVTYKEVVMEKGSPQELYDRAMLWIKQFYKNTNEVIKSSDRDEGVIHLRSSVKIYFTQKDGKQHLKNIVYYNFKLECRQDRYRYTITDFNEKAAASAPIEAWFNTENPKWDPSQYEYLNQIDEQIRELIASLEEGMLPKTEKSDDW